MPEMKGDELARRIRRQQPWAMRILMTGFGSILSKSVHRKFDFVFEKPAEPRSIIQVIRQKESGDDVKRVDSKNITVSR
jgi:FixJ family two-component response regulator